MKFKTFLEMVNKSDIPAYLRKNDKMTTKDLEKERTKNRSHPETIKKINGTVQEEVLDEANHREFASQGKMHPDMAKHMKTGEHMDYYEPKTGDKVHGKVMKNDGKEVHVKQTHDSYDPKKVGTVHKFTIASKLEEGYYEKPASAYRRKGDEIGGGSSKNDVPFDGPYTKTPATTKDKSGAVHTAMSRAKHLAKQAMKNVKEEAEQIDEISKKTVDDYKTMVAIRTLSAIQKGETEIAKSKQRIAGLKRANTRLAKEEVEEFEEQAPVAPVPDKKYIKGTPEHKAYKATKKPINGMPTNVKEALKGNQHKIDKNKNGKIDAHDFKLLRKEEVEQLDELSKGTLGSYIKKASNDLANKGAALGKKQADADEVDRYTNRHMPNQSDERERMRKAVGASHDDINKVRSGAIKRNKNIGKAVDRLSKEEFENGELETMSKSYKQFVESLNEIKMSDLPSRKVSGSSYGAQYHDDEGDDEEEKPKAKPAADAVKRGRGRPAGSKSGARQGGSAPKTKNGADYTGYKLHLPNKN